MKILFVTTVVSTMGFFPEHIKALIANGHTVELACNCNTSLSESVAILGCKLHDIPFSRSPVSRDNIEAYRVLKRLLQQSNFDIVHTHTPNASVCTRLACRKLRKNGLRVFYTAHGFHFYRGAPQKNWLLYYPIEWLCAHWTDTLITINHEDYVLAQKKMKAKNVVYVPGVGIDLTKFNRAIMNRAAKREELGVTNDTILLLSVGELNANKNHETVIRAIADKKNTHYILAGEGALRESIETLIDNLGLSDRVQLLGYRNDIGELCEAADVFIFPSFREGLSVSLMEGMASGLPVICSRIRGNTDLIDENGGVFFNPHSVEDCSSAIEKLLASDMKQFGDYNKEKIKGFSFDLVNEQMTEIIGGVPSRKANTSMV